MAAVPEKKPIPELEYYFILYELIISKVWGAPYWNFQYSISDIFSCPHHVMCISLHKITFVHRFEQQVWVLLWP